jgi:hypothetical protein
MARQTEKERQLLMARKKVGYEELVAVERHEDVDMVDVEMGEVRMIDADEAAAQELSRLSISEGAKTARRILVPRGPRGRGKFSYSNKAIASDQVHQRIRLHDPDRIMSDDRRGGGGYNNRKRRFNRGDSPQNTHFVFRRANLLCLQTMMRVVTIADPSAEDMKRPLPVQGCAVSFSLLLSHQ